MGARRRRNALAPVPITAPQLDGKTTPNAPLAELWEAWRKAQARTEAALNEWYAASKGSKAVTHAAYVAALDREELAAAALARAGFPEVAAAA
jgi:hypothetical protein